VATAVAVDAVNRRHEAATPTYRRLELIRTTSPSPLFASANFGS
jgi:hypothetical protein